MKLKNSIKSTNKSSFDKLSSFDQAVLTHHLHTSNRIYAVEAEAIFQNCFEDSPEEYHIMQTELFERKAPFSGPEIGTEKFTFIDLFAGIGGFRMALQELGGRCVFSSEWDKYAQKTYQANYGEIPFGDITSEKVKSFIPEKFDLICGGFPCQPFSLAGVSKKNSLGRSHGFDDLKQGNLFFHLIEIIEKHRPKAFFLENVKNLISHDKGNTFKVIKNTILDLGYSFDYKVIDGKHFVPQHRERTFMVGFDKAIFGQDMSFNFSEVKIPDKQQKLATIIGSEVDQKYTLSDKLWEYLQEYAKKHKAKGNGFGFGLVNLNGISRTMSARYHKDGAEILIPQKSKNPRRLTPLEAAALQGYPIYPININSPEKSLIIPVSDTQAYRQFGNSVVMPLIKAVGKQIVTLLNYE